VDWTWTGVTLENCGVEVGGAWGLVQVALRETILELVWAWHISHPADAFRIYRSLYHRDELRRRIYDLAGRVGFRGGWEQVHCS